MLAVLIGALRERRAAIPRVVDALGGDGLVVVPIPRRLSRADVRALHTQLGEHLAGGACVLVNAFNTARSERRALLAEGWHAVAVVSAAVIATTARTR